MLKSQKVLLELISGNGSFQFSEIPPYIFNQKENENYDLSSDDMSTLYTDTIFLSQMLTFISAQHWINNQEDLSKEISFKEVINQILGVELAPIIFMKDFFLQLDDFKIKQVIKLTDQISKSLIDQIKRRPQEKITDFARNCLQKMSVLYVFENELQVIKGKTGGTLEFCLYRAFDEIDSILNIDYSADQKMNTDLEMKERLYEKTGVGVQSGYSTILLALIHIDISAKSSMVDLGSGYGRVGMVVGLLYPEIDFIGYEYVEHRVSLSNECTKRLGIEDSVQFHTQDLSLKDFKIPIADIYYLYDPFSEDTYRYVIDQIVKISQSQIVVIVTKGNARKWFLELAKIHDWPSPTDIDGGNLSIFQTAKVSL